VTVAHWRTPNGSVIPVDGVVPDVIATTSDELIKKGKDPMLDKAVEVVRKMK
jgi:C-terminal processing protease CtpA/Prc